MFDTKTEGVFRSLWDVPRWIDRKSVDPAERCGVALMVAGVDHCGDVTEQPMDVGECPSLQSCKHCDMGVVGEHIDDDPRSYRAALGFVVTRRGGYSGSRCARLVRPSYPGDGGEAGVVVEKVVEGSVH